jgi:hypothetical protein
VRAAVHAELLELESSGGAEWYVRRLRGLGP